MSQMKKIKVKNHNKVSKKSGKIADDFDKEAIEKYGDTFRVIVMGHTHYPKILDTEKVKYIN